jgi:tetratricopeptide (TPR) repeat protein
MDFFSAELENLNEMTAEDNLMNVQSKDKFIFTQYIQDLYRFYKLHPLKHEFTDIFDLKADIHKTWFLNNLIDDTAIMRNIAEFYFEKDHYQQAFEIYSLLNKKDDNSYEIYEKMGYCSQRSGQYEQALEYYRKAELFDTPGPWLLKKIGLCYRNLKRYDQAIKYYEQVLLSEPENLNIQTLIGQCYLEMGEYEKALDRFYRVELLSSSRIRSLRPIAWISFILGKFDTALKYYQEIIDKEPNRFDYMNLGHVEWCLGNKLKAIELYKTSIKQKDNTFELFMAGFREDQNHLMRHGINQDEIHLMLDYLKYSLDPLSN